MLIAVFVWLLLAILNIWMYRKRKADIKKFKKEKKLYYPVMLDGLVRSKITNSGYLFRIFLLVAVPIAFYLFENTGLVIGVFVSIWLIRWVAMEWINRDYYYFDWNYLSRVLASLMGVFVGAGALLLIVDPLVAEPIFFEEPTFLYDLIGQWVESSEILTIIFILALIVPVLLNVIWLVFHIPYFLNRFAIEYQGTVLTLWKKGMFKTPWFSKKIMEIDFSKEYRFEEVRQYTVDIHTNLANHYRRFYAFSQNGKGIALYEPEVKFGKNDPPVWKNPTKIEFCWILEFVDFLYPISTLSLPSEPMAEVIRQHRKKFEEKDWFGDEES